MSSIGKGERRNARSFTPDLPSGLKDLLTVDLFSVYLLSRVDIVIPYIAVDFTFGLPDHVRYIEEFVISRFYSIHRISFVISRTSLNGGSRSLNRGSTVSTFTAIEPKNVSVALKLIPLRGVKNFKPRPQNRILFFFSKFLPSRRDCGKTRLTV